MWSVLSLVLFIFICFVFRAHSKYNYFHHRFSLSIKVKCSLKAHLLIFFSIFLPFSFFFLPQNIHTYTQFHFESILYINHPLLFVKKKNHHHHHQISIYKSLKKKPVYLDEDGNVMSACPRRASNSHTNKPSKIVPIPPVNSCFVFSQTNR